MKSQLRRLAAQNPDLFFKKAVEVLGEIIEKETNQTKVSLYKLGAHGLDAVANERAVTLILEKESYEKPMSSYE